MGTTVQVRTLSVSRCDFATNPYLSSDTVSVAGGRYAITSYDGTSDSTCVRLVALRSGSSSESLVTDLRVRFRPEFEALTESVAVNFTFP